MLKPLHSLAIACVVATPGCGGGGDDTVAFATGDFTLHTTVVDDQCLDGGLNLLFMPNGVDTPWEWPFPVTIHAEDELPVSYEIQLREPFGRMTVTAEDAGIDLQSLVADRNEGVLLGPAQFGMCAVDMDAIVQVQLVDGDTATGLADLNLSDPRGDERCPTEMPASCRVLLSFEATRK